MKVAVFGRFYNETTTSSVERLFDYLLLKNADAYIETEFFNLIKKETPILPITNLLKPSIH